MDERIRKLRRYFNLTQQEFAEKVGTTRYNIAGYETGKRQPSVAVVSAICDKCNVNEQWLRTGEGAMFAPEIEDALGAFIRERNLTSTDRILIEKFVSLSMKSRLAVVQYVIGIADALWEECKASVSERAVSAQNQEAVVDLAVKVAEEFGAADSSPVPDIAGREQTQMDVSTQEPPGKEEAENQKMPIPVSEDGQDELEGLVRKYKKNLTDGQQQQILEMMQAMIASQKRPLPASAQRTVDEKPPKTERSGQS